MKKFIFLAVFLIAFVTVFMVGCVSKVTTLDDLSQAIDNLEVASVQTDYQEITEIENAEVVPMSMSYLETNLDPLQEFVDLRTSFLENHLFKTLIGIFKESKFKLSEEDKVIILEKIDLFRSYML